MEKAPVSSLEMRKEKQNIEQMSAWGTGSGYPLTRFGNGLDFLSSSSSSFIILNPYHISDNFLCKKSLKIVEQLP